MAHNPEVEGSNPSPATKFAGQRPLPIMEGAFCVCRVHGIVHEAFEEGRRGGWAVRRTPRTSFATQAADGLPLRRSMSVCDKLQMKCNSPTIDPMSAQTLGFAVQPEDRPVLDELVAYFGDGNRSAYLRATLKVMKSIMIADQLREAQAYGQQRTAELGIDPSDIPARVQEFLKADS